METDYDYNLPKELIAQKPAEPRDAARLFVYDTKADKIVLDSFANLSKYLPTGSVLVLNDTKVVPARLTLKKASGGQVRILFLFNEWDGGELIKGLPDKGLKEGEKLSAGERPIVEIASHEDEEFAFRLLVSPADFKGLCDSEGHTPLPPYIHSDMDESELRGRYQTTFADKPASVAAPTASLHFTPRVFASLARKGIEHAEVTLHVGRGTFSPVTDRNRASNELHREPISVAADVSKRIADGKGEGKAIVAAGTTAMRLLESAAPAIMSRRGYMGETSIFIRPPYEFKVADALITNFHLPGTSLLSLLDAFLQFKGAKRPWRELYERAMAERFRFYSFGDAMLII